MQVGRILQRLTSVRQPWILAWNGLHSHAKIQKSKQGLHLEYEENIAIIHMNVNPENKMDGNFLKDINSILDNVESNKSCVALATIGNEQFYSNGFDLKFLASLPPDDLVQFIHDAKGLFRRILLFPMPTLAVLSGSTYAAGSFLAFAHDLRTMNTEKTHLSFTAVRENRRVSGFIRDYLNIKLGGGKNVADALVLARRYTAQDAHKNLLVHAVNPSQSLLDYSLQILRSFLAPGPFPRDGILGMKTDVYQVPVDSFEEDLKLKRPYFAIQYMTPSQLAQYKG